MDWNKFAGLSMLLYGLINPIGVIPIYMDLVRKAEAVRSQRIVLTASTAVAALLILAAAFGRRWTRLR